MQHLLGQTGIALSPIGLGASSLGGGVFGPVAEQDAIRGCCETQFRRSQRGTTPLAGEIMISDFGFRRCALSGVMKRFHQFGCAEHVRHAFYVVCHRCEPDFDPCTRQPAHQQAWVSEDPILDGCKGMLGSTSA
jgi:hypothetical protein